MSGTLPAPWAPNVVSAGSSEQPRILTNHFNADATQDLPDGINLTPLSFDAVWDLVPSDADAFMNFFRSMAGKSFYWTMPRETIARTWQATSWTRNMIGWQHDQVHVTLEERFLL